MPFGFDKIIFKEYNDRLSKSSFNFIFIGHCSFWEVFLNFSKAAMMRPTLFKEADHGKGRHARQVSG
jgi:hypothetical protein